MYRVGDILSIIAGLDTGKKGIVVEYHDDCVTCKPSTDNFQELYGRAGNYTFDLESVELSIPTIPVGDNITVRAESFDGKKNINKKAQAGMKGKVVKLLKFRASVEFDNGTTSLVGAS